MKLFQNFNQYPFINKLINEIKKWAKNIKANWKKVLLFYLVLIIVFAIFLLIDQLTKTYLFDHSIKIPTHENEAIAETINPTNKAYGGSEHGNQLLAIRSIWHKGVTLFENSNLVYIQILSVVLLVIVFILPLFLYNLKLWWLIAIILGMLAAGDLGNALDRFLFNYFVKDIFYSPYFENLKGKSIGTFNFADVTIFASIICVGIITIVSVIWDFYKQQKAKKENKDKNQTSGLN